MRRLFFGCLGALLTALAALAPSAANAQTTGLNTNVLLNIPAQSLEAELMELSRQASFQLLISAGTIPNKTGPVLTGKMPLKEALNRLLRDTDLNYKWVGEHTVTVTPNSSPVPTRDRKISDTRPADLLMAPQEPDSEQAASGRQAETTASNSPGQLDEILVSARKQRESIMNVPVIETPISEEKLDRLQAVDVRDLPTIVPGLNLGQGVGVVGTQVSIRGVGTSASDPGVDQSISLNIDGMSTGQGLAFQAGMFDLEQIEVLKGPQALFYGKSSPGGVISLRTADPTDKFELIARGSYEFESVTPREELIISGPLTDTLKARLSGMYSTSDGYFRNEAVAIPGTGAVNPTYAHSPDSQDYIIRGTVLWNPTDQFDARLKFNDIYDRAIDQETAQLTDCPEGPGFAPSGPGRAFIGGDNCRLDRNLRLVFLNPASFPGVPNNGVPFTDIYQRFGTLELNYRPVQNLTTTSVAALYDVNERNLLNSTEATAAGPALASENRLHRSEITEELRATSDFAFPLNFTAGALYEDGQIVVYNKAHGNTAYRLPALLTYGNSTLNVRTYSGFGQLRWKIFAQLELAGGARWTDETRTDRVFNSLTNAPVALVVPRIHSDNISPEVTLTYRPDDDVTLFGAYKQGYKSGSFSIATLDTTGVNSSFGDEEVQGGEGGLKTRLFDRQLALNLAAYYYHYSGLQVGAVQPAQNGIITIQTVNAGSSAVYGLDLDTTYRPQAINGLGVNGAINWNHARYLRLDNVPCWGGQTIAAGCNQIYNSKTALYTAQNLNGTPLIRAPQWQMNFGFDYDWKIGSAFDLVVTNNNAFTSRYVTFLAVGRPNSDNYQGSYIKTDLSVALRAPDDRWELALLGKNITDRITSGSCASSNYANGGLFGGEITGGTATGPAGIDQVGCNAYAGRELWIRLTVRPFARD
jgi:iron complex outermembrane receptor protein